MHFGSRLKELRINKKMSQNELAKKLNVTQKTISNYEKNERFPDEHMIVKIATFFNVSTDWLFGISNQEQSVQNELVFLYDGAANTLENIKYLYQQINEELNSGKKISDLDKEVNSLKELLSRLKLYTKSIHSFQETAEPDVKEHLFFLHKLADLFLSKDTPEDIKKDIETFYKYIAFKAGNIEDINLIEEIKKQ